ncbi:hypothetical protein [Paraburkholderia hospita]|uniref:hypothetical protein n=1 Tax=Paraburkholderia hospita TaxID=169430 RepID=UPI003ECC8179
METNYSSLYIKTGCTFLEPKLSINESIIEIEQGQTAYSKDPLLYYKFKIAKVDEAKAIEMRYVYLEIHSTKLSQIAEVSYTKWLALGDT